MEDCPRPPVQHEELHYLRTLTRQRQLTTCRGNRINLHANFHEHIIDPLIPHSGITIGIENKDIGAATGLDGNSPRSEALCSGAASAIVSPVRARPPQSAAWRFINSQNTKKEK